MSVMSSCAGEGSVSYALRVQVKAVSVMSSCAGEGSVSYVLVCR